MLNKAIDQIKKHNLANGWDISDAGIQETLTETDAVWEGDDDNRRWWTNYTKVVEIDGMLIGFSAAKTTGDDSPSDKGWSFDIDSVAEYTYTEETITVKKYKPVQ